MASADVPEQPLRPRSPRRPRAGGSSPRASWSSSPRSSRCRRSCPATCAGRRSTRRPSRTRARDLISDPVVQQPDRGDAGRPALHERRRRGRPAAEAAARPAGAGRAARGRLAARRRPRSRRSCSRARARRTAFVAAATQSQAALNRLLEDRSRAIKTDGGDVYIDFRPLIDQLGNRIAIVGNLTSQLPPGAGRVVIMKESQLKTAQDLTSVLKKVGSWFWIAPHPARGPPRSRSHADAAARSCAPSRSPRSSSASSSSSPGTAAAATSSTRS